jgi:hypothetical protein
VRAFVIGNLVIVVLLTSHPRRAWRHRLGDRADIDRPEVSDRLRGRTFAFVQSLVRITLSADPGRGTVDRRRDRGA